MVGSGNTNPPSIALLAYAAAECGLVVAAGRPPPGCWQGRLYEQLRAEDAEPQKGRDGRPQPGQAS